MKKKNKQSKFSKKKYQSFPPYPGDDFRPTAEQIYEVVDYWVNRLRLCDWNIKFHYCTREEMDNPDALGQCRPNLDHKTVRVKLLKPEYYPHLLCPYRYFSLEHCIVHELLHIHMDYVEAPYKEREREIESTINNLAEALVNVKYGTSFQANI